MSYGYEYPIAAQAQSTERAQFIRRTYGHLAGAILAFIVIEAALLRIPGIENLIRPMVSGWGWLVVLGLFMGVGWIAQSWAQSDTSRGMQYLGLSLYVVAEAIVFLPLLYVAKNFAGPDVIPTAAILTLAVFGGLTLAVFVTGKDFSFMGPILSIGGLLALGFIVASIFIGFNLGTVFAFAMVALMSGYILYYTSQVLYHYRTDQYVAASLALFAAVATLFWYILRIVMSSRN